MNNTFDIHRFGKLVRHDVRRFSPRFGASGASLVFILWFVPAMVLTQGLIGQDTGVGYRIMMVFVMSLGESSLIPIQLYASVARKKKRGDFYFAMLPASKCEKYLSIALLSLVIAPSVMIAYNVVLDTLLTAVHMPFYHKYMWQVNFNQWLSLPFLCNCVVAFVGPTLGFIYANAIRNKGWRIVLCSILGIWLIGSLSAGFLMNVVLDDNIIIWVLVAIQALLAILMGFLGWNKMNKISY